MLKVVTVVTRGGHLGDLVFVFQQSGYSCHKRWSFRRFGICILVEWLQLSQEVVIQEIWYLYFSRVVTVVTRGGHLGDLVFVFQQSGYSCHKRWSFRRFGICILVEWLQLSQEVVIQEIWYLYFSRVVTVVTRGGHLGDLVFVFQQSGYSCHKRWSFRRFGICILVEWLQLSQEVVIQEIWYLYFSRVVTVVTRGGHLGDLVFVFQQSGYSCHKRWSFRRFGICILVEWLQLSQEVVIQEIWYLYFSRVVTVVTRGGHLGDLVFVFQQSGYSCHKRWSFRRFGICILVEWLQLSQEVVIQEIWYLYFSRVVTVVTRGGHLGDLVFVFQQSGYSCHKRWSFRRFGICILVEWLQLSQEVVIQEIWYLYFSRVVTVVTRGGHLGDLVFVFQQSGYSCHKRWSFRRFGICILVEWLQLSQEVVIQEIWYLYFSRVVTVVTRGGHLGDLVFVFQQSGYSCHKRWSFRRFGICILVEWLQLSQEVVIQEIWYLYFSRVVTVVTRGGHLGDLVFVFQQSGYSCHKRWSFRRFGICILVEWLQLSQEVVIQEIWYLYFSRVVTVVTRGGHLGDLVFVFQQSGYSCHKRWSFRRFGICILVEWLQLSQEVVIQEIWYLYFSRVVTVVTRGGHLGDLVFVFQQSGYSCHKRWSFRRFGICILVEWLQLSQEVVIQEIWYLYFSRVVTVVTRGGHLGDLVFVFQQSGYSCHKRWSFRRFGICILVEWLQLSQEVVIQEIWYLYFSRVVTVVTRGGHLGDLVFVFQQSGYSCHKRWSFRRFGICILVEWLQLSQEVVIQEIWYLYFSRVVTVVTRGGHLGDLVFVFQQSGYSCHKRWSFRRFGICILVEWLQLSQEVVIQEIWYLYFSRVVTVVTRGGHLGDLVFVFQQSGYSCHKRWSFRRFGICILVEWLQLSQEVVIQEIWYLYFSRVVTVVTRGGHLGDLVFVFQQSGYSCHKRWSFRRFGICILVEWLQLSQEVVIQEIWYLYFSRVVTVVTRGGHLGDLVFVFQQSGYSCHKRWSFRRFGICILVEWLQLSQEVVIQEIWYLYFSRVVTVVTRGGHLGDLVFVFQQSGYSCHKRWSFRRFGICILVEWLQLSQEVVIQEIWYLYFSRVVTVVTRGGHLGDLVFVFQQSGYSCHKRWSFRRFGICILVEWLQLSQEVVIQEIWYLYFSRVVTVVTRGGHLGDLVFVFQQSGYSCHKRWSFRRFGICILVEWLQLSQEVVIQEIWYLYFSRVVTVVTRGGHLGDLVFVFQQSGYSCHKRWSFRRFGICILVEWLQLSQEVVIQEIWYLYFSRVVTVVTRGGHLGDLVFVFQQSGYSCHKRWSFRRFGICILVEWLQLSQEVVIQEIWYLYFSRVVTVVTRGGHLGDLVFVFQQSGYSCHKRWSFRRFGICILVEWLQLSQEVVIQEIWYLYFSRVVTVVTRGGHLGDLVFVFQQSGYSCHKRWSFRRFGICILVEWLQLSQEVVIQEIWYLYFSRVVTVVTRGGHLGDLVFVFQQSGYSCHKRWSFRRFGICILVEWLQLSQEVVIQEIWYLYFSRVVTVVTRGGHLGDLVFVFQQSGYSCHKRWSFRRFGICILVEWLQLSQEVVIQEIWYLYFSRVVTVVTRGGHLGDLVFVFQQSGYSCHKRWSFRRFGICILVEWLQLSQEVVIQEIWYLYFSRVVTVVTRGGHLGDLVFVFQQSGYSCHKRWSFRRFGICILVEWLQLSQEVVIQEIWYLYFSRVVTVVTRGGHLGDLVFVFQQSGYSCHKRWSFRRFGICILVEWLQLSQEVVIQEIWYLYFSRVVTVVTRGGHLGDLVFVFQQSGYSCHKRWSFRRFGICILVEWLQLSQEVVIQEIWYLYFSRVVTVVTRGGHLGDLVFVFQQSGCLGEAVTHRGRTVMN